MKIRNTNSLDTAIKLPLCSAVTGGDTKSDAVGCIWPHRANERSGHGGSGAYNAVPFPERGADWGDCRWMHGSSTGLCDLSKATLLVLLAFAAVLYAPEHCVLPEDALLPHLAAGACAAAGMQCAVHTAGLWVMGA